MRKFTLADCETSLPESYGLRLFADTSELVSCPLWYHERGLSQTASGYGKQLTSSLKIWFEGKLRRIYVTCYSNAGTAWFKFGGKRVVVS